MKSFKPGDIITYTKGNSIHGVFATTFLVVERPLYFGHKMKFLVPVRGYPPTENWIDNIPTSELDPNDFVLYKQTTLEEML